MQSKISFSIFIFILLISLTACGSSSQPPTPNHTPTPTLPPTVTPLPTSRPYRLRPGEMELAADSFLFPTIIATDDLFISIEKGDQEITDDELVLGLTINDQTRAYPIKLLSLYEVVNDTVGGQPVVITWCPLCYSAVVYVRRLDRELTFGVSGYLFNNNLVMVDHQSNTYWSQILGEGIRGAYKGQRLPRIPFIMTNWGAWKQDHPDTLLLSAAKLGNDPQTLVDPYTGYYQTEWSGFGSKENDDRLPPKELVIGIRVGDQARAYSASAIAQLGIIQEGLADLSYLLVYDPETQSVFIYARQIQDQLLTFQYDQDAGTLIDDQTGSLWDIQTGAAISGEYAGRTLESIDAMLAFWFAWSDFFPETEVFIP